MKLGYDYYTAILINTIYLEESKKDVKTQEY